MHAHRIRRLRFNGNPPEHGGDAERGFDSANIKSGLHVVAEREIPLNERNKILLTRDIAPALLPIMAFGALCVITLRYGRRGAWRQVGFALQGWLAGMLNQRDAPQWIQGVPDLVS